MKNINKVIISGNLTRDPEVRQSASGSQFMTFGVACNDRRRNAQGEWEDKPNYVDCTLFGKSVEWLSRDMARGTKVCVCGKLDYQSWQDKDGNNRSKLAVIAEDIEVMPKGAGAGRGDSGDTRGGSANDSLYDSDCPF